ncbi:MAG: amidohydrolase family protein [Archangium sp.]|nr:amidohydrolase family protein [Archangium sp.]
MRTPSLFVALTLTAGCVVHLPTQRVLVAERAASRIVIHDTSVFTATSTEVTPHHDVIVHRGRIEAILPAGTAPALPGDLTLDGRGKTLLPGLVDMHAHVTLSAAPPWYLALPDVEHNLQAHLYAGVTTVNDLGGAVESLHDARRRIAEGDWLGPRLFFAGTYLTRDDGYPASMLRLVYGKLAAWLTEDELVTGVETPEAAALAVRRHWADGVTMIKIIVAELPHGAPRLTPEQLDAIVAEAHGLGLKVAAHVDSLDDALLAAAHGVDWLAHGVVTSALSPENAQRLAASGIIVAPTLAIYDNICQLVEQPYVVSPMKAASEPPELLERFSADDVRDAKLDPGFAKWIDAIELNRAQRKKNALALFQAGVPLVVGTDAQGAVATFAADIHEELRLLVEAGIPNAEVLLGATSRAARLLQAEPPFGTIEPGKSADLLLVDGDPLTDITATSRIAEVIVRGRLLTRAPENRAAGDVVER